MSYSESVRLENSKNSILLRPNLTELLYYDLFEFSMISGTETKQNCFLGRNHSNIHKITCIITR